MGIKLINPLTINDDTDERITIDPRQRLLFKKLLYADSGIYSCWQNNELVGTIRLEVVYEIELKFDHRIMMIGGLSIILVLSFVFLRAYKGRKRYTKH